MNTTTNAIYDGDSNRSDLFRVAGPPGVTGDVYSGPPILITFTRDTPVSRHPRVQPTPHPNPAARHPGAQLVADVATIVAVTTLILLIVAIIIDIAGAAAHVDWLTTAAWWTIISLIIVIGVSVATAYIAAAIGKARR